MLRHLALIAAAAASAVVPASAQLPGASSLKGVYNVRYLGVKTTTTNVALSFQGQMTFDGNGGYTITGQGASAEGTFRFRPSGGYTVLSSGMMLMDDPFDPVTNNNTKLFGAIGANGAVIGSATDGPQDTFCDLFVAVPAATTASLSTLNGAYRVAHLEFLAGDTKGGTRNTFFTMNANGSGSLGDVTITGTAQSLSHKATTQTSVGATYTMAASGAGTLVLPAPGGTTAANTLLSGNKVLFVSADGNFFVAGSQTGYDMEIGVRTSTTALNGFYWTAYLNNYLAGGDSDGVWSGQGSASQAPAADNREISHLRTCWEAIAYCYDSTSAGSFAFDANGTVSYGGSIYGLGVNGTMAIGSGQGNNYLLTIYLKAPAMTPPSGTTVFLNPQGVVNAASFSPVTSQVSPGEMITLFGSGFGPSAPAFGTFPLQTTLAGVQVLINKVAVPIVSATAGQVSVIVPYDSPTNGNFLDIQIRNNGVDSNIASVYSGLTGPGLFLNPAANAPFNVAAVKPLEGPTPIGPANPVKAGDVVSLYLSGLGEVKPGVAAGVLTPSGTVSAITDQYFAVYVHEPDGDTWLKANVSYAGLAGFGGFYQVNITIPQGVTAGNARLIDIETIDASHVEGTIAIAK